MSDINPGVRLLEEGSGDLIGLLPGSVHLAMNDQVEYGPSDGVRVLYKVEKVRYVCEYFVTGNPVSPDAHSVYGRIDVYVSVVP